MTKELRRTTNHHVPSYTKGSPPWLYDPLCLGSKRRFSGCYRFWYRQGSNGISAVELSVCSLVNRMLSSHRSELHISISLALLSNVGMQPQLSRCSLVDVMPAGAVMSFIIVFHLKCWFMVKRHFIWKILKKCIYIAGGKVYRRHGWIVKVSIVL